MLFPVSLGTGFGSAATDDFKVLALLALDALLTVDFAESTDLADGVGDATYATDK